MDQNSASHIGDLESQVMSGVSKKRILVIEDVPETQKLLKKVLVAQGYHVSVTASVKEAIKQLQSHGIPHLAIVDIHLPDGKGFEFCSHAQSFCDLPIILCTSDDDPEQAARSIWQYAEDYLTKPININELCARVYRVLLRQKATTLDADAGDGLIKVDACLAINFAKQQVFLRGADPIHLTAKETKILYILMHHAPASVPQDLLIDKIWGNEGTATKTLHVHIHSLRRKISWPYIHTTTTGQGTYYLFEYRG